MNALIIGGSRGIGAATATLLRRNGWQVDCIGRGQYDVTQPKAWPAKMRRIDGKLDALIYCAGEWLSGDATDAAWLRQYQLSVIGLFFVLCYTTTQLVRAHGCVVAVSSTRGLIGGVKTAAYSCGKAAQ